MKIKKLDPGYPESNEDSVERPCKKKFLKSSSEKDIWMNMYTTQLVHQTRLQQSQALTAVTLNTKHFYTLRLLHQTPSLSQ